MTSLVLESADHKDPETVGNRGRRYEVNYGLEAKFSAFTAMFAYQFHSQEQGIKDNIFGLSARIPALGGDVLVGTRYLGLERMTRQILEIERANAELGA